MIAVIFAGGLGERLRPLTRATPKPLIPIKNRPFLWYQIRLLSSFGVKKFIILTGYLSNLIEDYFEDGKKLGVEIIYSKEESPLGTGGALKLASPLIKENFLLLNGDDIPIIDYALFFAIVKSGQFPNIITVHKGGKGGNLKVDKRTGYVLFYSKVRNESFNYVHSGLSFFNKDVLALLPNGKYDVEEKLFNKLAKKKKLVYFEALGRTLSIGTYPRLRRSRFLLERFIISYIDNKEI